jgi:signal transduction histidine kinase
MIKNLKNNAKELTILCVDDEQKLREYIVTFCKKVFGKVLSACDGQNALEIYNSQKIDIIITDLKMPVLDGMGLISNIRQTNKQVPIIVLSAYTEVEYFMKTIDLGIDGFITKPINFDTLIITLEKAIEKIVLRNENEEYKKSLEQKVQLEMNKRIQSEQMMLSQARYAAMGEMIGMIAHQWRQPLSAITSTANALEIKVKMEKYDKEYFENNLEKITSFTSELSTTIDDFRNFFKSNKSKEKTTIEDIITHAIEFINITLKQSDIELFTDFDCNISADLYSNEIKQVVLNLISNAKDALKYTDTDNDNTKKGKTITIKTFKEDEKLCFSISDNGGGVDENIIDKIFDPYFTTKESKNGTGLGLYMSKTIIEEHCHGELIVDNIVGVGANFIVKLGVVK